MPAILSKKAELKKLIKKVNEDKTPIILVDEDGQSAILFSMEDFESMNETIYLLSSRINAEWLNQSIQQAEKKKSIKHSLFQS
ncbi:type II toxin-antitoxin system Phd/YefM family antitoxin [Thermodesulfovibrio sp. TK110]